MGVDCGVSSHDDESHREHDPGAEDDGVAGGPEKAEELSKDVEGHDGYARLPNLMSGGAFR